MGYQLCGLWVVHNSLVGEMAGCSRCISAFSLPSSAVPFARASRLQFHLQLSYFEHFAFLSLRRRYLCGGLHDF